jgi:hypothetical protein
MIENIDIRKLVDEIHAAEAAQKEGRWKKWCEENGFCLISQPSGRPYCHANYANHVTRLYTLRAACRGKLHRKNPPQAVRDYAAHIGCKPEQLYLSQSYYYPYNFAGKWSAEAFNEYVASKVAERFTLKGIDLYTKRSRDLFYLRKDHGSDYPPGADDILDELEAIWDELSQEERDELNRQPSMTWPRKESPQASKFY